MKSKKPLVVVIMAAGKGTRMKDPSKAKVMYEVLGKPMLHYVVELAKQLTADRIITIVGYQRDAVQQYLHKDHPEVEIAVQAEQLGTGHAIMQTEILLKNYPCDVVVLSGDVPLLMRENLQKLLLRHGQTDSDATILTADFPDPTGYGRIVRDEHGGVKRIVEHKDATEEEKNIHEINSGIYIFNSIKLFDSLQHITPQNAQNEYYLTDVFTYFRDQSWILQAQKTDSLDQIVGVNTLEQLETVQVILEKRVHEKRGQSF
jgi:UDP-N-acetylglucosamine diphosphorylase/glucosamine-1-phosphate N-acetyltransferase